MSKRGSGIKINGAVLRWARESIGLSREDAAEHAAVDAARIAALEDADGSPLLTEVRELARVYRRPLSVLLGSTIPDEEPFPTDFRTVGGRRARITPEVLRALRYARRLRDFVSDVAGEHEVSRVVAGIRPASTTESSSERAALERLALGLTTAEQLNWPDMNVAYNHWRGRLQGRGILTIVQAMPRADCRGFALWSDHLLPAIVVSREDPDQARTFTLLHEYSHLLLRSDAACLQFEAGNGPESKTERWCNRLAAAILLPQELLEAVVPVGHGLEWTIDEIGTLAKRLKVSRHVAAIRLEETGYASGGLYRRLIGSLDDTPPSRRSDTEPRIRQAQRQLSEVGFAVALTAWEAFYDGEADALEVAELLGVGADRLPELASLARQARTKYSGAA